MTTVPAVRLAGVARRFPTADGGMISALETFDLDIAPGEFCAIVGPTGCGKSTTLGLVAGLARPQAGSVQLFGRPVGGVDRRVGFVFQQDALFPWRTVLGNVLAGPGFRGETGERATARARDWLGRVGLAAFETAYPHQLSGGMRKRVALARAAIAKPALMLYDEPTSGLDPVVADSINKLMVRLGHELKMTSVIVTHDMVSAREVGDRIAMLHEGRIYCVDVPKVVLESEDPIVKRFVNGISDASDAIF